VAGVFARDDIDFAQHSRGAVRQVFKIADGGRDYIERSGHAAILAPSSTYKKGTRSINLQVRKGGLPPALTLSGSQA